jgi:hypothetical protein
MTSETGVALYSISSETITVAAPPPAINFATSGVGAVSFVIVPVLAVVLATGAQTALVDDRMVWSNSRTDRSIVLSPNESVESQALLYQDLFSPIRDLVTRLGGGTLAIPDGVSDLLDRALSASVDSDIDAWAANLAQDLVRERRGG